MIDLILIKIFLKCDLYVKYYNYLKLDYYKTNSKDIYKLFLTVKSLQESSSKDYSIEDLILHFNTQYPFLKTEDREFFKKIFNDLEKTIVDDTLVLKYLEQQRQQAQASEIAIIAVDVAQGRKSWDELALKFQQEEVKPQEEIDFVTDNLEELYNATVHTHGLRWRLATLNKMLGSLRKGNFGFVFARPETGKTTFLASEITFMAAQSERPIVWFNNEESGAVVATRCYQAALGLTNEELFQDFNSKQEEYRRVTKENIKIIDDAGLSRKKVEAICKQVNPGMIIFDQIDKIYGFDAERYDLKMKTIYQWARELAKTYGPTIGICQAGGTAEGQKYLKMTDVDSSHTAKQGEADFIIGIGMTNNDGEEAIRYLHTCKNKLSGDEDSISELRHGKMSVKILPEVARYEDIMTWT